VGGNVGLKVGDSDGISSDDGISVRRSLRRVGKSVSEKVGISVVGSIVVGTAV